MSLELLEGYATKRIQQFILNVLKESLVRLDNVILLLVGDGEDRRS